MTDLLPDAEAEELVDRYTFLQLISDGVSEVNAGLQIGWTPGKVRTMLADPDFAELVQGARDCADGIIEHAVFTMARNGNLGAAQMWLYNRQANRWRDTKRIEVKTDTTVNVAIVAATKQSILEMLREHGTEALQPAAYTAIEADARDDG